MSKHTPSKSGNRQAEAATPVRKTEAAPLRTTGGPGTPDPRSGGTSAAHASGAKVKGSMLSHEQVAIRAYELWEAQGKPQGEDVQNWCEAERELQGTLA